MSALGHVWTAPWQELSDIPAALVGCGHVSGLFVRQLKPLAIMLLRGSGPNRKHAFQRCDDPNGFSRSPERPCLHYVVMSSPIGVFTLPAAALVLCIAHHEPCLPRRRPHVTQSGYGELLL